MIVRRLVSALAVLLLGAAVVRDAAVNAWTTGRPDLAARWWPGHPAAEGALAEREIATRAGRGQAPDQALIDRFTLVAAKAPLEVSPLLVHAITAQQAGQAQRYERLLQIAEQRRPRELAPHYFLAEQYLRKGQLSDGLREFVRLVRLAPGATESTAPYVAQYARSPEHWPAISAVLQREPKLGDAVLVALAQSPENVPAILALARGQQRRADAPWVNAALQAHVAAKRYAEARALWARLGALRDGRDELVHSPDFRDSTSPGPFNWVIAQSAVGSAERAKGGGLHVLSYGSQGGSLIRQLLILPAGRYRLVSAGRGRLAEPQALSWSINCEGEGTRLLQAPVKPGGVLAVVFTVPAGCPAQWISLDARAQDIRGDSDVRIAYVRIERAGQ